MCPYALFAALLLGSLMMACAPTVQLTAPSEPTNINLSVKIKHEIYIKVDRILDGIINGSSGLS